MKSVEEITQNALKSIIPEDYGLLELHCYLCIQQLLIMYNNNQKSKEQASKIKQRIYKEYNNLSKDYEFERSMFQEHIENIKKTEKLRTKLRKMLNGQDEYEKPITEESLAETLNVSLEILHILFKGEF